MHHRLRHWRRRLRGAAIAVLLAQLACAPALAQPVPAEQQPVHVSGMRNPELKRYRAMAAGLDAFDNRRALAPAARELRFRLRARASVGPQAMDGLTLHITGSSASIPVPIAADGSFVLPRSKQAHDEDADLILNKKKGGYRWHPQVRSEGVPAHMRRLGDLRLECQVLVAVTRKEMPFWTRALINGFLLTTDWCSVEKLQLYTVADRKLAGAILVHGNERRPLPLRDEGNGFVAPLGDRRYPDDTLIELQFAE